MYSVDSSVFCCKLYMLGYVWSWHFAVFSFCLLCCVMFAAMCKLKINYKLILCVHVHVLRVRISPLHECIHMNICKKFSFYFASTNSNQVINRAELLTTQTPKTQSQTQAIQHTTSLHRRKKTSSKRLIFSLLTPLQLINWSACITENIKKRKKKLLERESAFVRV